MRPSRDTHRVYEWSLGVPSSISKRIQPGSSRETHSVRLRSSPTSCGSLALSTWMSGSPASRIASSHDKRMARKRRDTLFELSLFLLGASNGGCRLTFALRCLGGASLLQRAFQFRLIHVVKCC